MSIKKHKDQVENSFKEYEAIQEQHLNILQTNPSPDLKGMTRERDAAFLTLKGLLNDFIENAGTIGGAGSLPVLTQFEERVSSIIRIDGKIALEIDKYRSRLKKGLEGLKQGKNAMHGYKMAGKNPNRPCVVSMNR